MEHLRRWLSPLVNRGLTEYNCPSHERPTDLPRFQFQPSLSNLRIRLDQSLAENVELLEWRRSTGRSLRAILADLEFSIPAVITSRALLDWEGQGHGIAAERLPTGSIFQLREVEIRVSHDFDPPRIELCVSSFHLCSPNIPAIVRHLRPSICEEPAIQHHLAFVFKRKRIMAEGSDTGSQLSIASQLPLDSHTMLVQGDGSGHDENEIQSISQMPLATQFPGPPVKKVDLGSLRPQNPLNRDFEDRKPLTDLKQQNAKYPSSRLLQSLSNPEIGLHETSQQQQRAWSPIDRNLPPLAKAHGTTHVLSSKGDTTKAPYSCKRSSPDNVNVNAKRIRVMSPLEALQGIPEYSNMSLNDIGDNEIRNKTRRLNSMLTSETVKSCHDALRLKDGNYEEAQRYLQNARVNESELGAIPSFQDPKPPVYHIGASSVATRRSPLQLLANDPVENSADGERDQNLLTTVAGGAADYGPCVTPGSALTPPFKRWQIEATNGRYVPRYAARIQKDQLLLLESDSSWQPPLIGQHTANDVPLSLLNLLTKAADKEHLTAFLEVPQKGNVARSGSNHSAIGLPAVRRTTGVDLPDPVEDLEQAGDLPATLEADSVDWPSSPPREPRARSPLNEDFDMPKLSGGFVTQWSSSPPTPHHRVRALPQDSSPPARAYSRLEELESQQDPENSDQPSQENRASSGRDQTHDMPSPISKEPGFHAVDLRTPARNGEAVLWVEHDLPTSTVAHRDSTSSASGKPIQVRRTPYVPKISPSEERIADHTRTSEEERQAVLSHPGVFPDSSVECVAGTFDGQLQSDPGETEIREDKHDIVADNVVSALNETPGLDLVGEEIHIVHEQSIVDPMIENFPAPPAVLPNDHVDRAHSRKDPVVRELRTTCTSLSDTKTPQATESQRAIRNDSKTAETGVDDPAKARPTPKRKSNEVLPLTPASKQREYTISPPAIDPDYAQVNAEIQKQRRSFYRDGALPPSIVESVSATNAGSIGVAFTSGVLRGGTSLLDQSSVFHEVSGTAPPASNITTFVSSKSLTQGHVPSRQMSELSTASISNRQNGFQKYKLTYPEYDGSRDWFDKACWSISRLLAAHRAPHPSLWDDFVFRQYHDYLPYLTAAAETGGVPMKLEDFYNRFVERPLHFPSTVIGLDYIKSLPTESRSSSKLPCPMSIQGAPQRHNFDLDRSIAAESSISNVLARVMPRSISPSRRFPRLDPEGVPSKYDDERVFRDDINHQELAEQEGGMQSQHSSVEMWLERAAGQESPDLGTPDNLKVQDKIPVIDLDDCDSHQEPERLAEKVLSTLEIEARASMIPTPPTKPTVKVGNTVHRTPQRLNGQTIFRSFASKYANLASEGRCREHDDGRPEQVKLQRLIDIFAWRT